MKKQLFSLLLILTFVFSVSAQKVEKQSKVEKNLRTHVSYLASDKLEGRRTGEKGATFAAGYVSNMFARYKLKAGVQEVNNGKTQKSFLQKFPYVAGIELGQGNSLKINNSNIELKNNWVPVAYSPNGSFANSEVVFAGFGIASDELKYDDYANVNASNKIALVLGGTPDAGNPHSEFSRFNSFAKANIARAKGAKALLIIASEENFADERLAQMNYNQTLGETAIPTVVISRQTAAKFFDTDEKGFEEIEKWLAMRKDTPENIRIRIANLPKMSADLSINLVQKQAEAYNVIGIVEGRDPLLKNEAIVIGAHYDHLGRGGEGSLAPNSKEIHNGADDNASGTSAMIELARQFRKEKNNKRTLIFIGFGGEEEGLLGSKYYVNNPVFPIEKTVAMINMDMVGRLNEGKLTVGGIGTASEWENLVNQLNAETEISHDTTKVRIEKTSTETTSNGVSATAPERSPLMATLKNTFTLQLNQDGFGPSDHSSFYGKQIPVLFFFTGTHTDYHKPSDDSDKINYDGLENITEFVGEIVRSIDQNPTRPTYAKAQSSNMMGGRRGFNVSLGTIPSYSDSANDGLVLDGVRDDSPAAKAGIKGGDKIVKIGDKEIRNISDYMFMLGEMKAGEEYEVVVMRGDEKLTLKIIPDARK